MELAASILWYLALAAAALYVFLFPGASRWIILVAILIFTGAELVVYFTVRYAVFLLERFRQPFRRHAALRRAVRTGEGCDDYASWRSRAEELDRVDGRERWKTAPGGPYNAPLIAGLHADLKEAMRRVESAMAAQEAVAPAPALAQAPATATSASARAHAARARARARARALGLGGADGSDVLSCLGADSEDELWAGAGGSDAEGDQSFGSLFGSREGSATGGLSRDDDDDDDEDDEDLTSENEEKVSHKPVFRTRKPAVAHEASQTGSMLALGGAAGLPPLTRAASASKGSPLPQTDAPKTTPPLSKLQLALPVSATAPAMEVKPPSSDVKPRAEGADEGEGPPPPSLLSCILSPGGALQPLPPGQEGEPEPLQLPTTAASAGGVAAPPATEPAPALVAQVPTVTSEDGTEPGSAPAVLSHSTDVSVETREREPEREKTASSVGPPVSEDDGASAFSVASTVPASISSATSAASTAPAASIGSAISAASTAGTGGSTSPSRALASALRDLRTLLQLSARHNVGGTMSESLYSHTNTGTKRAVEDFLATVADATRLLARAPALPAQLRLKALTALRRTHGHTALCLSGGGGLGQYHTGVVRTLLAQGLLPRVISGTSAGALVAAHVCCRTDEELKESLRGESFAEYMGFDNGLSWFQKAAAWFKRGHVFDPAHWDKLVNWHCAGDLTFQEAYERTGRTLVITATSTHQHEPPLMLSRLTTPRVLVSSAIVASASVPGLLPLATLREKAPDGTVRECKAPFRDLRDGSFKSDIPMSELAFYCNANYFIVSQVNPHIAPFFFFSQGDAGRGVGRWAGWRGGYLLSFLESLLKHDMRKNLAVLRDMGMLPTIMGADWSFLFLQPFGGHVTLVPPIRLRDYVHIIDAPSVEESDRYFKDGELMVWRKTTLIETRVRFGKVLVEEMERLRAEIGGKSCPEGEDDAGAAAAPAEPLVPAALMDQVPATD